MYQANNKKERIIFLMKEQQRLQVSGVSRKYGKKCVHDRTIVIQVIHHIESKM